MREDLLKAHKPDCHGIGQTAVRVEMPEDGKNRLTFQSHHKQLPAPFIIYTDFESLTTKIEGAELDPTKSKTPEKHNTIKLAVTATLYCAVTVKLAHR